MGNASVKPPPGDPVSGVWGIAKFAGIIARWPAFVDIVSQVRLQSHTGRGSRRTIDAERSEFRLRERRAVPYVIDGNNLLGSWGGPAPHNDRRAEVVRRVAAFCRARGAKATL